MTEVYLPDGIVNIGERAFYICPKLTDVRLPSTLRLIEQSAFNYCRSLKELALPDGVISIGPRAFYDCVALESLSIPASVGFIGKEAFAHCPKLTLRVEKDSYAHEYCRKAGLRFVLADGSAVEKKAVPVSDEYEKLYKFGNLFYEKESNDYRFKSARTPSRKPRYVCSSGVWKQIEPNASGRALIACAGDLMCEPVMSEAAYCDGEYSFNPMFKPIAPVLHKADLTLANLETTVTERFPYSHEMHIIKHHTGPRFHCNAPLSYLDALRFAGFDGFVLSNNHNADCGYEGILDTVNNLNDQSFMHTGLFRNEKDPRVLIVEVNGIRLGLLSYTEHINRRMDEEILTPLGRSVMLNQFSEEKLKADVAEARKRGAEFLICYIHFLGNDYSHDVHPNNVKTAKLIAESGVDCVMGSHMHAVQRYERLRTSDGRSVPLIYSLGNFISSETKDIAKQSVVYMLSLEKKDGKVLIADERYVPCFVLEGYARSTFTVYPLRKITKTDEASLKLQAAKEEIVQNIGALSPME